VLPSVHPSPQPKRQIDRFSRFCTDHGKKSAYAYFTMGAPFPKNCPFPWGSGHDFFGQSKPTTQTAYHRFSRFCTDDRMVSLCFTMGRPSSKLPLPIGEGVLTQSNTWFLGHTRVLNPNGISIGSAIFAGLTSVTDRQTTLLGR